MKTKPRRGEPRTHYTTGLHHWQIIDLCARVAPIDPKPWKNRGRPQKLGLYKKLVITLAYLNRNRTQHDLAETYGVDQSTVSAIIAAYTTAIKEATGGFIPTADDLDPRESLVIDGSLLPNWSWEDHREDYSGKHRTTGLNVQVACSLDGTLRWVSDPAPGSTHDANALRASGLLDADGPALHVGDRGYQGLGMITPVKRLPGQKKLSVDDSRHNTEIARIRYVVERAIANIKTWRILHTDYRRPHHTQPETITAVIGLIFYKLSFS
jgi:hypothetical protein